MRRILPSAVACLVLLAPSLAAAADLALSPADTAAAYKAAGYKQQGRKWMACAEGKVTTARDINGDGLPDVVITESGTQCHGMTGEGYSLVSKQPDGSWRVLSAGTGMLDFLKGPTVKGWPDIQIGGPGFCFPVHRFNGREYVFNRSEYEGKRCKPKA